MTFSQAQLQAAESFISNNPPQDSTIPREVWLVAAAMQEGTPQWQPIGAAPKDLSTFLVVKVGTVERWHDYEDSVVVTISSSPRPVTCFRFEDGSFMDEFAEEYQADGRVHDAGDLTEDDDVLRLVGWMPLPPPPSSDPKRQSK